MKKSKLIKKAVIICAALVTLNPVIGEEFKNSIVNIKFDKDTAGNIKINLITAKPYTTPLFINKKEDNNYVILLPETNNLMASKPIIDDLSGLVSGVTIKTQPYVEGSSKGYTKIIISAPEPINLRAVTSLSVQGTTIASNIPTTKQVQVTQKTTPVQQQKLITPEEISKHTTQYNTEKSSKVIVLQADSTVKSVVNQINTPTSTTTKTPKKSQIVAQTPVKVTDRPIRNIPEVTINKDLEEAIAKTPQPNILIKEKEAMEQEIKTEHISKIKNELKNIKKFDYKKYTNKLAKISKEKLSELANLINLQNDMVKLILVISAVGFPLLVIFYILVINRRIKDSIEEISQIQSTTQDTDSIRDENLQEVIAAIDEQTEEQSIIEETESSFENMMSELEQTEAEEIFEEITEQPIEQTEVEEVFEEVTEQPIEQTEVEEIFEEITEQPIEQTEVEEVFEEVTEQPIEQTEVEEVFEEITEQPIEQTEAEEIFEEVTEQPIEQTEAEEIFEEVTEQPIEQTDVEEVFEEVTEQPLEQTEVEEIFEETTEYIPDGFINEFANTEDDDSIFDELINSPVELTEEYIEDDTILDELQEEIIEEEFTKTEDGLIVLDRTDLTETSGFYLVNFENFTSLIGFIEDEIFVLKTFDEFVNNHIYVKVADKVSEKVCRYIVKIGLYKMIIEVSDTKMIHMLDL